MSLREIRGVWFDEVTGETYVRPVDSDPLVKTPFTFENASWTGPLAWMPRIMPWGLNLNPLGFATKETSAKILKYAQDYLLKDGDSVELVEDGVTGPFTRTPERSLVFHRNLNHGVGGAPPVWRESKHSCGLIANTIIATVYRASDGSVKFNLANALAQIKAELEAELR